MKFTSLGAFGLAGVGLIWLAVANSQASEQLSSRLEALRAAGQPVSIADLAPEPVPPEKNAATYLGRAKDGCDAIGTVVQQQSESEEGKKLEEQLGWKEFENCELMIRAYRAALEAHPEVATLLKQATELEHYQPPIDYKLEKGSDFTSDLLPHIQTARAAARVLNYRLRVMVADGQDEAALDTGLEMLRLSRLISHTPGLVGELVAIAIRGVALDSIVFVLKEGEWNPAMHANLEAELARVDNSAEYRQALRTERALGLSHFQEGQASTYLKIPMGKNDLADYFDVFQVLIETADAPYFDADARSKQAAAFENAGPLTASMRPAVDATHVAVTRGQAVSNSLRVLNAILANPPAGNEVDLPHLKLPPGATLDPFNGQPLRVEHTADGWVVYSVGTNLKDEGGEFEEQLDVGVGPIQVGE